MILSCFYIIQNLFQSPLSEANLASYVHLFIHNSVYFPQFVRVFNCAYQQFYWHFMNKTPQKILITAPMFERSNLQSPTKFVFFSVNGKLIITRRDCARLIDGFLIGWLDLLTSYTFNLRLEAFIAIPVFPHFTVHRYTRTRALSLH
jgi:hypothetical protein